MGLPNPFGIAKKVVTWTTAGFSDRFASRLTGKKVTFGQRVAAKIDQREPWDRHLEISAIEGINKALSEKDFEAARILLAFGAKEDAVGECLQLLSMAIELLAHGEEITFELFQCLE